MSDKLDFQKVEFEYNSPVPVRRLVDFRFYDTVQAMFDGYGVFPIIYERTEITLGEYGYERVIASRSFENQLEAVTYEQHKKYVELCYRFGVDGGKSDDPKNDGKKRDIKDRKGYTEINARKSLFSMDVGVNFYADYDGIYNPQATTGWDNKTQFTTIDGKTAQTCFFDYGFALSYEKRLVDKPADRKSSLRMYYDIDDLREEYDIHSFNNLMSFEVFVNCVVTFDTIKMRQSLIDIPSKGTPQSGRMFDSDRAYFNEFIVTFQDDRPILYNSVDEFIDELLTYFATINTDTYGVRSETILGFLAFQIWRYDDGGDELARFIREIMLAVAEAMIFNKPTEKHYEFTSALIVFKRCLIVNPSVQFGLGVKDGETFSNMRVAVNKFVNNYIVAYYEENIKPDQEEEDDEQDQEEQEDQEQEQNEEQEGEDEQEQEDEGDEDEEKESGDDEQDDGEDDESDDGEEQDDEDGDQEGSDGEGGESENEGEDGKEAEGQDVNQTQEYGYESEQGEKEGTPTEKTTTNPTNVETVPSSETPAPLDTSAIEQVISNISSELESEHEVDEGYDDDDRDILYQNVEAEHGDKIEEIKRTFDQVRTSMNYGEDVEGDVNMARAEDAYKSFTLGEDAEGFMSYTLKQKGFCVTLMRDTSGSTANINANMTKVCATILMALDGDGIKTSFIDWNDSCRDDMIRKRFDEDLDKSIVFESGGGTYPELAIQKIMDENIKPDSDQHLAILITDGGFSDRSALELTSKIEEARETVWGGTDTIFCLMRIDAGLGERFISSNSKIGGIDSFIVGRTIDDIGEQIIDMINELFTVD